MLYFAIMLSASMTCQSDCPVLKCIYFAILLSASVTCQSESCNVLQSVIVFFDTVICFYGMSERLYCAKICSHTLLQVLNYRRETVLKYNFDTLQVNFSIFICKNNTNCLWVSRVVRWCWVNFQC